MPEWRFYDWGFLEGDAAAQAWFAHPETLGLEVTFRQRSIARDRGWRVVSVVTPSWVELKLKGLNPDAGAICQIWPSLIIVPDGSPEERRDYLDRLMARRSPLMEQYSRPAPKFVESDG